MEARLLAFSLALVACAPPEVTLRGRHVELIAEEETLDTLCGGSFPFLDDVSGTIAARLQREGAPPIPYHWRPEGVGQTCGYQVANGCAVEGDVFAVLPLILHELVHAHADGYGRADPFLEEGLAEYLGGGFLTPGRGDPRDFYGHQRHLTNPSFYATAGRFVGELVASAGIEKVVEFYEASEYFDPAETLESKLEGHLEVDIEDVIAEMRNAPACGSLAYREKPIICGRVPIEISNDEDTPTNLAHDFDCALSDTLGTIDSMHAYLTVSITDAGRFRITADEDTSAMLIPCAPLCENGNVLNSETLDNRVELRAGLYAIRLTRTAAGTAEVIVARD